jgi:hypothetical protein
MQFSDLKDLIKNAIRVDILVQAHWALAGEMPRVSRAWNKVRSELYDIGLLYAPENDDDGGYLDQIELEVAAFHSLGEAGYVFERTPWITRLAGYREGVIYLPVDLPSQAYVPGSTLTDTIRHEYAHAWHWLEPDFFERPWFRRAFKGGYEDCSVRPSEVFADEVCRHHRRAVNQCRSVREVNALTRRLFYDEFVSDYAGTLFCEDFADTFMVFLRHRNRLSRFKNRTGVYRKLLAIQRAVDQARRELGS